MKQLHLLALSAALALSTNLALAQGASAPASVAAAPSQHDCDKASKMRHDHAAESGRGTPRAQAKGCPPVASASATAAAKANKKARHDHPSTKN